MRQLISLLSFFMCSSVFAERYLCVCCKENSQVVEMVIKNCKETVINKYPKLNDLITYTDLQISGTVIASVPYNTLTKSVPNKVKREGEDTKTYVYEERDGTTCQAFTKGSKLLMLKSKVMCGDNIEGDLACLNKGNIVKFLPEKYLKLGENHDK